MTKLRKGIQFIKKIGDGVFDFVDKYNQDTLYLFDFEDVKQEYTKVLKIYNNNASAINLRDFSKNFAFGYYMKKGLLDYQSDAETMTEEVHAYLLALKEKGEI